MVFQNINQIFLVKYSFYAQIFNFVQRISDFSNFRFQFLYRGMVMGHEMEGNNIII